jgi:signal transduction histidine kinase
MEPLVGNFLEANVNESQIRSSDFAAFGTEERMLKTERASSKSAWNTVSSSTLNGIRNWWARRSLFEQFAIASSLVLTLSVVTVGAWVSARIADGVLHGTSGAAALYMTNFVEPYVQSMEADGSPTPDDVRRLDAAAEMLRSRRHVASIKIWRPDGTIVYSTQTNLIGKRFSTADILPSLQGQIRAAMADLNDDDSEFERSLSVPLYEIFLPLYKNETETIIAVAEIYEDARALLRDQARAVRGAWLVVGSAGLGTLLVLFAIVHQGSSTIRRQKSAIKQRLREKMLLHRKNDVLKSDIEEALRTAVRIDDLIHTRIGAELHDGPAQLMSFVLLRLEEVEWQLKDQPPHARTLLQQLREALQDALKDLRAIAAGLLLADVGDTGNLAEVVRKIIRAHEHRAACEVDYREAGIPEKLPRELVHCIVRVTQEALTNAFRHSGSRRQTVILRSDDEVLRLSVRDDGRGFTAGNATKAHSGLGLPGMASRVRALGGRFSVLSKQGQGTEIICEIRIPAVVP